MMSTGLRTRNRAKYGFTLVELLVVIAIIMLLVTLVVPSLSAFLDRGRGARTATTIRTLESGLELFRAEPALGKDYVPLAGEEAIGNDYPPSSFRIDKSSGDRSGEFAAFGAEVMVWALAGPTLQGTAGSFPPPELATPTASLPHRFGPFLDVSKAVIERPLAYNPATDLDLLPTFMDDFGMPILYFKADSLRAPLYFHPADNALFFRSLEADPIFTDPDSMNVTDPFYRYIEDTRATKLATDAGADPDTVYVPHNRDTFLLISAGPDQRYGTADDICNFPFTAVGE